MYFPNENENSEVNRQELEIVYRTSARNNFFISHPTYDLLSKNGKLPHEFITEQYLDLNETIKLFRDQGYSDQIVDEHMFLNDYLRKGGETITFLMNYFTSDLTDSDTDVYYELVVLNNFTYVVLSKGFLAYIKKDKNHLLTFLKDVMYRFEHVHDKSLTYKRSIRYAEILSEKESYRDDMDLLNLLTDFV